MIYAPHRSSVLSRVMMRVRKEGECLVWQGPLQEGYGHIKIKGRLPGVHKAVYEAVFGEIPKGLVIDHLCRNRACCNPLHLEVVTSGENVRRGEGPCARNARKTQCKHGHEFTAENTYITPANERRCRICMQRIDRQQKAKLKLIRLEAVNGIL